jgi:hypothetical protein
MGRKIVFGIFALGLLAGCGGGLSYALDNYKGTKPVKFSDAGQKFRVFDKPSEKRLMITPSIGSAALQGATFGSSATPEMTYQAAAQAYVTATGRNCKMGDMRLIVEPQWETFYTCD